MRDAGTEGDPSPPEAGQDRRQLEHDLTRRSPAARTLLAALPARFARSTKALLEGASLLVHDKTYTDLLSLRIPARWLLEGRNGSTLLATATPSFRWEPPGEELWQGLGALATIEQSGPLRFVEGEAELSRLAARLASIGSSPALIGGFAFRPGRGSGAWHELPSFRFVLPHVMISREREQWWWQVSAARRDTPAETLDGLCRLLLGALPGGQPGATERGHEQPTPPRATRAGWRQSVAEALGEIRRGALRKVVLARSVGISLDRPVDLDRALAWLGSRYPGCYRFGLMLGQGRVFLGASPERLVRLKPGGCLELAALAGSTCRGIDQDSDRAQAAALLASDKDRREHAMVVEAIRQAVAPSCSRLEIPPGPSLLTLPNLHHLHTPIAGLTGSSLLALAGALHPTPATGGAPTAAALRFQDAHEGMDRGWYCGGVGLLRLDGTGELAVGLRSALIDGDRAWLYAGAGLVAGSDAEAEWEETELKLRPMRQLLAELCALEPGVWPGEALP